MHMYKACKKLEWITTLNTWCDNEVSSFPRRNEISMKFQVKILEPKTVMFCCLGALFMHKFSCISKIQPLKFW